MDEVKDAKQRQHMPNPPIESKPSVNVPRETEPYDGPPIQGRPETYPPNLFSGQQRRLQFEGMEPGMVYRIFNDEGNNISLALRQKWVFSDSSKIKCVDQVTPSNKDIGTKVCYEVGLNAAGHPLYAYVMEMPIWLWEYLQTGPDSREEHHKALEQQIRTGRLGDFEGRLTPTDPRAGSIMRNQRISVQTQTVKTTNR